MNLIWSSLEQFINCWRNLTSFSLNPTDSSKKTFKNLIGKLKFNLKFLRKILWKSFVDFLKWITSNFFSKTSWRNSVERKFYNFLICLILFMNFENFQKRKIIFSQEFFSDQNSNKHDEIEIYRSKPSKQNVINFDLLKMYKCFSYTAVRCSFFV